MTVAFEKTKAHERLLELAEEQKATHLKKLISDDERCAALYTTWNDIHLDYSRQKVSEELLTTLLNLAEETSLKDKMKCMLRGDRVNTSEDRSVLHTALRLPKGDSQTLADSQENISSPLPIPIGIPRASHLLADVHAVQARIKTFAHFIRANELLGVTGKPLKDVICVGIGGSYLGTEFVYEALRTYDPEACAGRRLRFLANVDPVDVKRATEGFYPETTLIVVISKTFTTAETMLNARTLKSWLLKSLGVQSAISKHFCAVSTNHKLTSEFGINPDNVFQIWDWVGGRFSVTSAVGLLPLAIHFGWNIVQEFLNGCYEMDKHFGSCDLRNNLPVLMGLMSFYNTTYLGLDSVAILPYAQSLHRFAAHIQQLTMESNGKRVRNKISGAPDGSPVYSQGHINASGEIYFGEPGTNGQHSFYQLLHHGRVIPSEFIGFAKSQNPIFVQYEAVSNHDELMSNFFAQPDALALGKSEQELQVEGVKEELVNHKTFSGDRPSSVLLFPECSPFYIGCLLALYEHRTAVEGFLFGVNSFDQWGVELGKSLAKEVRSFLKQRRGRAAQICPLDTPFVGSTNRMMELYVKLSPQ